MKKTKLKTKEELLEIMSEHLARQQEIAIELRDKLQDYLEVEEFDVETKKLRNHYLNAYNTQVDAVSRTASSMIRIFNSSLESEQTKVENETEEELVD